MSIVINAVAHKNTDGTYSVKVYHAHGVVSEVIFSNPAYAETLANQYANFLNILTPTPEQKREQAISFAQANVNIDREEKGEEPIAREVFEQAYEELHPTTPTPVTQQTTVMGVDITPDKDETTVVIVPTTPVVEEAPAPVEEAPVVEEAPTEEPAPVEETTTEPPAEEAPIVDLKEAIEQVNAEEGITPSEEAPVTEEAPATTEEAPAEGGKKKGKRK